MNQLSAPYAPGAHADAFRPHDVDHLRLPELGIGDHIQPSGFDNQPEPIVDIQPRCGDLPFVCSSFPSRSSQLLSRLDF
jgi:hypothetical protein